MFFQFVFEPGFMFFDFRDGFGLVIYVHVLWCDSLRL